MVFGGFYIIASRLDVCSRTISTWFLFNGLQLNLTKSEALLIGTRDGRTSASASLGSSLTLAGSSITFSSSTKILGVTLDSSLNFDAHVSEICRSANYHLRALSQIRNFLSVSSANMVACAIVASRLDYCNAVLNGLSSYNLHRLQTVQNRAARIVLGVGQKVAAEQLLRQLHWLPVVKRIQFKTALITFKTLSSHEPSYLSSLLVPYNPSRTFRSSNSNFLTVPRVSTSFQARSFSVAAPRLWNTLPTSLRLLANFSNPPPASLLPSCNVDSFKRQLKNYLFDLPPSLPN